MKATWIEKKEINSNGQFITKFLEYALVLSILLECNTMYTYVSSESAANMEYFLYGFAILLEVTLLFRYSRELSAFWKIIKDSLVILLFIYLYVLVFYLVNVRHLRNQIITWNYCRNFVFSLPLLILLFRCKRKQGQLYDFWYIHSNIICFFGILNLAVYLASIMKVDQIPSYLLLTRWSNLGRLKELSSFMNLCIESSKTRWQIEGIPFLRNFGIFTEPLMFSIPLITALFTEMFLRDNTDKWRIFRWVLLSVLLITSQTTLGIILMTGAWGLKGLEICIEKKRLKWIFLIAVMVLGIAGYFVINKIIIRYAIVPGTSIADHIDDFKLGIKAFLSKPFAGGGYLNEDYIRTFMSEARYKANRGFSNSIAIVLGEGGILLGLLCMFPFFVFLWQIRSNEWRKIALWSLGPLGLYTVTIFHFHLFLIFIFAFGYALIDISNEKKHRIKVLLNDDFLLVDKENSYSFTGGFPVWICFFMVLLGMALFIVQGEPLWTAIHSFLLKHQLSLTQSAIKAFYFNILILFHVLLIYSVIKHKLSIVAGVLAIITDGVFLSFYAMLYSSVNTLLVLRGIWNEVLESSVLICIYFLIFLSLLFTWRFIGMTQSQKKRFVILMSLSIGFLVLVGLFINHKLEHYEYLIESEADELSLLTDSAAGRVFVNDNALLYKRINPEISFAGTKGTGYRGYQNATVVFKKGTDLKELFDAGYQVAELTSNTVVYSNDEQLISSLVDEGKTFYRYYPFTWDIDLSYMALRNNLSLDESGIHIGGELPSMIYGPYEILKSGKYTASYELALNLDDYRETDEDAIICRLRISYNYGEKVLVLRDVSLNDFDTSGKATVEVSFNLDANCEGVEYLVFAEEGKALSLQSLKVRHTPDYITVSTYNGHNMPLRESYYTLDGDPYKQAGGYAAISRVYNLGDQVLSESYYDGNGDPIVIRSGYAQIQYKYNRQGSIIKESYYGTDGKPIHLRSGQAAQGKEYDEYGNLNRIQYLDEHGNPIQISSGYAEVRRSFNALNQMIREEYYGINGEKVVLPSGYGAINRSFDNAGNLFSVVYLDKEDQPAVISNGYAEIRYTYNGARQIVREEYFDTNGGRVLSSNGAAILQKEYDDVGNVSREIYYDIEEEPSSGCAGYAQVVRLYNEKRQNIIEKYFDVDGKPVSCTGGYYGIMREYDDIGNVAKLYYINENEEHVFRTGGYAGISYTYDEYQNAISERYLDKDGQFIVNGSGIAELRRLFNEKNLCIAEYAYDLEGNKTLRSDGTYGNQRFYDERNRLESLAYINDSDDIIANKNNVSLVQYCYNELNLNIQETYHDDSGTVLANTNGIAAIRKAYNDLRFNISEDYYDSEGTSVYCNNGYSGLRKEYDNIGNNIEIIYVDNNGLPVTNSSGYAKQRREYDDMRNCIAEYYYDTEGNAALCNGGYSEVHREYDEARNVILQQFCGVDGSLVVGNSGYAEVHRTYNKDRKVIREEYYNTDGTLIELQKGYAVEEREYDEIGGLISQKYYDIKGNEVYLDS